MPPVSLSTGQIWICQVLCRIVRLHWVRLVHRICQGDHSSNEELWKFCNSRNYPRRDSSCRPVVSYRVHTRICRVIMDAVSRTTSPVLGMVTTTVFTCPSTLFGTSFQFWLYSFYLSSAVSSCRHPDISPCTVLLLRIIIFHSLSFRHSTYFEESLFSPSFICFPSPLRLSPLLLLCPLPQAHLH